MRSRRILACITALAVAWTALWPLVSAARMLAADEPMVLCHQAGTQVAPGEMPMQPGVPAERKQHCPLCIMAFYGAFGAPVVPPAAAPIDRHAGAAAFCAPLPGGTEVQLPQSRAPPAFA